MVERPLKRDRLYVEVELDLSEDYRSLDGLRKACSGRDRCVIDVDMFMAGWATLPTSRGKYYRYQQQPPTYASTRKRVPARYAIHTMKYGPTVQQTSRERMISRAEIYTELVAA